jgi:hypothetical protein
MALIVKTFNNGWGNDVPLKQLEQDIVDQYLNFNNNRTILINSTWYTKEYHQQVVAELQNIDFDQIVLVSMLDAAIPQPSWYQEFNRPVYAIGYYPGANTIDFWALTVDQYFQKPDIDLLNYNTIDTAYMCLNRKPHWHRKHLYNQLTLLKIAEQGIVSMGGDNASAERLLIQDAGQCDLAPNAGTDQTGIANDIMSLGHSNNWQRHFLNIITETQYDITKTYFVSEKIYKPIIGCRPFLVYSSDGAVEWLTARGFEPYTNDFSDISNLDLTDPMNMAPFLVTLCKQSPTYWQTKFLALKDKVMYNNSNFQKYVTSIKTQISKGMQCQI